MPTTKAYLKNLIKQRNALADNLTARGAASLHTELLDSLVPKVLEIKSGVDGAVLIAADEINGESTGDGISEKLSLTADSKAAIKSAIESKGVSVGDTLSEYGGIISDKLTAVDSIGFTHCYDFGELTEADIENGNIAVKNSVKEGFGKDDIFTLYGAASDSGGVYIIGNASSYGIVTVSGDAWSRQCTVILTVKFDPTGSELGSLFNRNTAVQSGYFTNYCIGGSGGKFAFDRCMASLSGEEILQYVGRLYGVYAFTQDSVTQTARSYLNCMEMSGGPLTGAIEHSRSVGVGKGVHGGSDQVRFYMNSRVYPYRMRIYSRILSDEEIRGIVRKDMKELYGEGQTGKSFSFSGEGKSYKPIIFYENDVEGNNISFASGDTVIGSQTAKKGLNAMAINDNIYSSLSITSDSEIRLYKVYSAVLTDLYRIYFNRVGEIMKYNERIVSKITAEPAYAAYCHSGGWFIPVVISEYETGVGYTMDGIQCNSLGSFEYGGRTWYYNTQSPHSYQYSHAAGIYFMGDCTGKAPEEAAKALAELTEPLWSKNE